MSKNRSDILDKLIELHERGIFRRDDYYLGTCIGEAINEIVSLRYANSQQTDKSKKE